MSRWEAFRSGLLGNVLNPKAVVFFPALMPQFISSGSDWALIGEFAAVAMAVCAVWFLRWPDLIGLMRLSSTGPACAPGSPASRAASWWRSGCEWPPADPSRTGAMKNPRRRYPVEMNRLLPPGAARIDSAASPAEAAR